MTRILSAFVGFATALASAAQAQTAIPPISAATAQTDTLVFVSNAPTVQRTQPVALCVHVLPVEDRAAVVQAMTQRMAGVIQAHALIVASGGGLGDCHINLGRSGMSLVYFESQLPALRAQVGAWPRLASAPLFRISGSQFVPF